MKVIQNNNIQENVIEEEYICEECNSVFVYDDYDIYVDKDGEESVTCPCCNHRCIVYTPVTEKNVEFPKSFYQFGKNINSVKIDDKEITKTVKKCINYLKDNPEEFYRFVAYGDTFICVFNHDDEYYVMVAKNYFEVSVDK